MPTSHIPPVEKRVRWVQSKRWLRLWVQHTSNDTLAPLVDGNAKLQYLLVVVVLALTLERGYDAADAHLVALWDSVKPFLYAIPLFLVLNALGGIFKTNLKLKELGQWNGDQFTYNEPLRALTVTVTEADNDKTQVFTLTDPEIDALVETKVVIDAQHGRVQAQVVFPHGQPIVQWAGWHPGIGTSLKLPADRRLGLRTNTIVNTDPTIVRVYVTSWRL